MRGASALGKVLEANTDAALRVLVVWEPVMATDLGPPDQEVLALVRDRRARHFWDEKRLLSDRIVADARSDPERFGLDDRVDDATIVWDFVALWPAGTRWDGTFPAPAFYGAPVVKVIGTLEKQLEL